MLVITILSIYCVYSFSFLLGVNAHFKMEGIQIKHWALLIAPIYLPFLLGEMAFTRHKLYCLKLRRLEDQVKKEKAEAAKKAAASTLNEFAKFMESMESFYGIGKDRPIQSSFRCPETGYEKAMRDFLNGKR